MNNKIENIIEYVKINNGCNLDTSGNIKNIASGFMVSIANYEKTVDINNTNKVLEALKEKIKEIENLKKENHVSKFYIGLWMNESKLYIDISINIKSKQKAILQGVKHNQFYIYDIKNACDIPLEKNVFIVYKYNKQNNDFIYMNECKNQKEVSSFLGISKNQFYNCLVDTIDNFNKSKLYLNKFCIVKDKAFIRDLV